MCACARIKNISNIQNFLNKNQKNLYVGKPDQTEGWS